MNRMEQHPILTFDKGRKVTFTFEGKTLEGYEGESVAAALHANGVRVLHESEVKHRPRGLFCAIGNCSSCMMKVDGVPNVRTCVEPLREGLRVERQEGHAHPKLDVEIESRLGERRNLIETDILVVGAGPAGMCAAIEAAKGGAKVILVERGQKLGGQLVKQTHKFFGSEKQQAGTRGITIAEGLEKEIAASPNIELWVNTSALGYYADGIVMVERDHQVEGILPKRVIVATGAFEKNLVFPNNDLPGVYGAGAVQTLMNLEGVLPGKDVIMIGAGNIGLIVSYQLLQAGVNVKAVVEAAPRIGGYEVHAAKLRRAGVPILTSHTVSYAYGEGKLEGAVIHQLDEKWQPIPGTEKDIKADIMCMAVGLSPLVELFFQAGCEMKFVPELGGYVPALDDCRRTSVGTIYAAGDASGVEEASSAMLTGKIAGLSAANDLAAVDGFEEKFADYQGQLQMLRQGPGGAKIRSGVEKLKEGKCVDYAK
ncbi:FAD-dependent oxidoreductase [Merdimmobilis hominis]|uniref:FAD-dependent oxidoreductase n=2 Tax=Merdimmobilis hominis TaxID=2897707 RepID=UPI0008F92293|nr:FAD-dependent oxidoreductase [Merdimmobilis hominis]